MQSTYLPHRALLFAVVLCIGSGWQPAFAQAKKATAKRPKPLVLSDRRTYRFDVQKTDPEIEVLIERHWTFEKEIPRKLRIALKDHPKLKKLKKDLLRDDDGNVITDSGYIRWAPTRKRPGALLWYVNGAKRRILGISIDLTTTHPLPKKLEPTPLKFDDLQLTIDLEKARLDKVRLGKIALPDADLKPSGIEVNDSIQVDVVGTLTAASSKAVRAADDLLSGDITQRLRAVGFRDLKNESHHGITLGWLGHEDVEHELLFLMGKPQDPIAFRYRVSGSGFPLILVGRQLQDDGWPLVLTGYEYAGTTREGKQVFRPVQYVLEKRPAKKKQK